MEQMCRVSGEEAGSLSTTRNARSNPSSTKSTTRSFKLRSSETSGWRERYSADTAAALVLYGSEPIFMPQFAAAQVGRDAVRTTYEQIFQTIQLKVKFTLHEVESMGELAYVRTTSAGTTTVLTKRLVSIGLRCLHARDTLPMCSCPACIMGSMGRAFDGSHAEYTLVPQACVFPIERDLDWAVLGAIPEMFQTAYGSRSCSHSS